MRLDILKIGIDLQCDTQCLRLKKSWLTVWVKGWLFLHDFHARRPKELCDLEGDLLASSYTLKSVLLLRVSLKRISDVSECSVKKVHWFNEQLKNGNMEITVPYKEYKRWTTLSLIVCFKYLHSPWKSKNKG